MEKVDKLHKMNKDKLIDYIEYLEESRLNTEVKFKELLSLIEARNLSDFICNQKIDKVMGELASSAQGYGWTRDIHNCFNVKTDYPFLDTDKKGEPAPLRDVTIVAIDDNYAQIKYQGKLYVFKAGYLYTRLGIETAMLPAIQYG